MLYSLGAKVVKIQQIVVNQHKKSDGFARDLSSAKVQDDIRCYTIAQQR